MTRTPEDIQDELLVLQCQDGDAEALKTLIGRWQPRLGALAWRLTGQREAARDVVQDAWLAIVRGFKCLDDPAAFRTWAYRIVSHKCADWTRRRVVRRRVTAELHAESRAASDDSCRAAETADDNARVRAVLDSLPEEFRAMLVLYYLEEMNVADIARVLDVPEGTVKSRLFHARKKLKESLERKES